MDRRLKRSRAERAARAIGVTVALIAALTLIDRAVLGPSPKPGWRVEPTLESLATRIAPPPVPAYLPDAWHWPPHRIWHRTLPTPAWWIELAAAQPGGQPLWLGSCTDAPPAADPALAACLSPGSECPPGWNVYSQVLTDKRTVFLVTAADAVQVGRLLGGLGAAPP